MQWLFARKKRIQVKGALQMRMNRRHLQELGGQDRQESRGPYCEVVYVVPCPSGSKSPQFDAVYPALTRDISAEGISLVQPAAVDDERILIGLSGDVEPTFLDCTVEHCTPLGLGFFQVGLRPVDVVQVEFRQVEEMRKRTADICAPALQAPEVASPEHVQAGS